MKRKISIHTLDGKCHEFVRDMTVAEVVAFRRQYAVSPILDFQLNDIEYWEMFNRSNIIKVVIQPAEEVHGNQ